MRAWLIRTLGAFGDRYSHLLVVLAFNVPVIVAIMSRNLLDVAFSGTTLLYAASVICGYYVLLLLVLASIIHVLLMVMGRLASLLGGAIIAVFVFYLLLDSFVYDLVKFHIDLFWLDYIIHDYEGLGLPETTLYTAMAGFLLVVALEIGIFMVARRFRPRARRLAALPVVLVLAFAVSQVMHIVAYQRNDSRITSLTPHFPLYVPTTSHKNAIKYGDLLPIGEDTQAAAEGDFRYSSLRYPLGEIEYEAPPPDALPNIVFILLESWRWDVMDEVVTPNIHALAERSSVFTNHISSGNQTTCGIFSLFYGLHPTYWAAVKANSTAIDNPVLMDVLVENDYSFGVFARSKFERHKIKDTIFRDMALVEDFGGPTVQDHDAELTDMVKAFIEEQSDQGHPYMLFVFYKSSHFNYCYPARNRIFRPARNMRMAFVDDQTDPEPYLNDYRNAVHYCDEMVGDVLACLEATGELDNTVIVLTTDHGEAFNDQRTNSWGHGSSYTQYQTRVPMIIHFPGREPSRMTHRTAHIDLAPTLLRECFGCTTDVGLYANGRSLYDADEAVRPLVVGSYFNHAFVIGDDVYEIFPMYTRKYKLDDIEGQAAPPDPSLLRGVMAEMNRFFVTSDEQSDVKDLYK